MTKLTLSALASDIQARAKGRDRIIVGISGAPGSGKSTLADDLAARLGPTAAVLPMDGFHLNNDQLHEMGLFDRKGAPETFDAAGFVRLLNKVRGGGAVSYPTFDREADSTVPGGGRIGADTTIVLAEGNYLLLETPPWAELAGVFDLTVHLDVPRAELEARLIARWRDHGLPEAEARARALGNDMRNADFVADNSRVPDVTLRSGD